MIKPKQLIPTKDKNEEWWKNSLKYYDSAIPYLDYEKIKTNIKKACGKLEEIDYTFATNPYNLKEQKNRPAKLKNYSFQHTIILQLLGEFLDRQVSPMAYNKNSDISNKRKDLQHQLTVKSLQQQFVNSLIKLGMFVPNQTDEQGQPIEPPLAKEAIEQEVTNLVDEKTIQAQALLEYEMNTKDVIEELIAMWYYFISSSYTISYKDIINDEFIYKFVKPKNFGYLQSQLNSKYIEDSEAVKYTQYYSLADLAEIMWEVEGFQDIYPELEEIESSTNIGDGYIDKNSFINTPAFESFYASGDVEGENKFKLTHIQWSSPSYMYRKYITNVFGVQEHVDLDDSYIITEGEQIEKKICTETWEGYIINDKYYLGGTKTSTGRADYNNPNVSKKNYNGMKFMDFVDEAPNIIEVTNPYQEAYNVVKYKINQTFNKNKDKILSMPLSLLNGFKTTHKKRTFDAEGNEIEVEVRPDEESTIGESLHFADTTQFLFIDDVDLSPQQAQIAATLLKSIDLGLGNYMSNLISYAESIKVEAEEAVGFNRYRKGQTGQRDAVGNVQQGQYAGSLITEIMFNEFNRFLEREFQGIIDMSRYLHRNGIKATYFKSNYEEASVDIPPQGLSLANIGITVKSSGKEKEDLQILKQRALEFAQNGASPSTISKIIRANDYANIEKELELIEMRSMQQAQQAQQAENQLKQQELELRNKEHQDKIDIEKYKIDTQAEIEALKHGLSMQDVDGKLSAEERKTMSQEAIKLAELKLKDKEIDAKVLDSQNKLAIAIENKQ